MSKEYKFSINIYIDNESLLETTISSFTSDKEFFRSSVQLILIDSLVTKESTELCLKYTDEFPENIYFVDCQGKGMAESFNDARVICLGSYLSFIRAGDYYSQGTLKGISETTAFMKASAICVSSETSRRRNGAVPYNFGAIEGQVNLKEYPDRVGLIFGAYFFKHDAITKLRFAKTYANDFSTAFILDLLLKTKLYLYIPRFTFSTTHSAENDIRNLKQQYFKSYFTDFVIRFIMPVLKSRGDSPIVMNIVMYLIYLRFACGLGDRYMFTMGSNSVNDFFNLISEAMQAVDDAIILNRNIAKRAFLPPELTFKMLRLKYRNKSLKPDINFFPIGVMSEYEFRNYALKAVKVKTNGCFTATLGGAMISSSDHIDVRIMSISLERASLRFIGYVTDVSCLDKIDYELFAVANREKIPFRDYQFYSLKTLFEIPFDKGYGFTFSVPLGNIKEMTVLSFFIALGGMSYRLRFSFGATGAHLTEKFPHSYFVVDGRMVTFDLEARKITIRRAAAFMRSKNERLFLSDIKHAVPMQKYIKIKRLRKKYLSTVDKYSGRKIWLMCDSTKSASHDGYDLYNYINSLQDKRGVEAFYSQRGINPDDAFIMTAMQSTKLACGSAAQKIIAMNADVIVANGYNVYKILGFEDGEEIFYRDLLMADIVSFGGGFSMTRSAQVENRFYDNTTLRFCGSQSEYDRLIHPIYGYDKKHLFSFGYPHTDRLMSVPSRQILVCPALRRSFGKYSRIGYQAFTTEPLYSVFNALINDKRLLSYLDRYLCNIVLILPEEFAKKEYLWNKSEKVTVSSFEELGYKETIEKSAMLITDYSNIAFDFAYMHKPIIYYQNPNVSCQDNISTFSYREQGFGTVVTDIDTLVEEIRKVIESDFKMSSEYTARREDFFAFIDRNSCTRIANAIYDCKYNNKLPVPDIVGGFGAAETPPVKGSQSDTVRKTAEKRPVPRQQSGRMSEAVQAMRSGDQIYSSEKRSAEQLLQQNVRYAEAPQKARPAHPQTSSARAGNEVSYAEKRPARQQIRQQNIRYAESPKNTRPASRPTVKPNPNGGARYADQRSSDPRKADSHQTRRTDARSTSQRAADFRDHARRSVTDRSAQRQHQQRPRQNPSIPRHASRDKGKR